jgi:hypothetical protein
VGLGEKKLALDWLEKAYEERSGRVANLAMHPQFVSLHEEPRFQKIVQQLKQRN